MKSTEISKDEDEEEKGKRMRATGMKILVATTIIVVLLSISSMVLIYQWSARPIYGTGTSTSCQYVYLYEPPWNGFGVSYSGGYYKEPVNCVPSGTYQYIAGYTSANVAALTSLGIIGNYIFLPFYLPTIAGLIMVIKGRKKMHLRLPKDAFEFDNALYPLIFDLAFLLTMTFAFHFLAQGVIWQPS